MGKYIPPQTLRAPGEGVQPRYPVYIPSKGRHTSELALTARWLARDGVRFVLVVEPQERAGYDEMVESLGYEGLATVLTLPFRDQGATPARNWISDYAREHDPAGRHWQLDDNTYGFYRCWKNKRVPCRAGLALRVCEDFTDRYENIAISGLNYDMFDIRPPGPLVWNCHVYSCMLLRNDLPYRWRGEFNMDTDLCLQVLSGGWCTCLLNAFCVKKKWTMQMKGGHTDGYQQDGRLRMARILEREWPGVVEVKRRFQRPQHVVKGVWRYFDTQPRLKPDVDLAALPRVDEYGMGLEVVSEIKSERIRRMVEEHRPAQSAQ